MIEVAGITKRFGAHVALDAFDLTVAAGARVAVLGPSGCGKTTLLRVIAGLEMPDGGTVRIGGVAAGSPSTAIAPHRRGLGYVFQDGALFPHMTVAGNVAYGVRGSRDEVRRRVKEMLALSGLADLAARYPAELSGGQQRRVALARALAPSPKRLLMDEPLTNLDDESRSALVATIDRLVSASGASLLYVTHDAAEAESLSCHIVRMRDGRNAG